MHPNMGSMAPSGKILATGDIEPASPFDATGSAIHAHYERVVHSSPFMEHKVAWNSSYSFSQANNDTGTGIEPRPPSALADSIGHSTQLSRNGASRIREIEGQASTIFSYAWKKVARYLSSVRRN